MNIYVGNLSYSISDEDLKDLFEEFGTVASANIIIDRDTQRSKGFGFVEMEDENEALDAIEELDGCEYEGRNITVNKARPKKDAGSFGGRSGRGGRSQKRY